MTTFIKFLSFWPMNFIEYSIVLYYICKKTFQELALLHLKMKRDTQEQILQHITTHIRPEVVILLHVTTFLSVTTLLERLGSI
jgi:hypothetical protein